jgi:hypothetical protein
VFTFFASANDNYGRGEHPGLMEMEQCFSVGGAFKAYAIYGEDTVPPVNGTLKTSSPFGEHPVNLGKNNM